MVDPSASQTHHRTTQLAAIDELIRGGSLAEMRTDEVNVDVDVDVDAPARSRDTPVQRRRSWLDAAIAGRARRGGEPIHLSPGVVIPGTRYRLLRWLGDGGMGVVYEAEHVDIERRVAVKILRPEVCDHPKAIQHFRDEARAAGRIGSAHIIEVLDFAELPDGRLLYAMELLSGRSLSRELGGRPMAPARVIAILRQVCKGLASAHAAHIVHRDIKPDNIYLSERESRRDAVKLLDFGISVFLVEATTTDAHVVGTPHYLAPELIAGKPFDARVDMYAVGCTAFEMLTGRPPFEGTIHELLSAHLNAPPPSIAACRGDHEVPDELEAVIRRCLAKRPEDRYADMDDLEAALCEAQIAARLETGWDDLSLPNVDVDRRDLLLRRMPDPTAASMVLPRPRRRSYVAAALAGALALGGVVLLVRTTTAQPAAEVDPLLVRLEAEARAAAGRVAFVYPPADDPDARTAYQAVLELEGLRGHRTRAARDLARALRREFATTLGAFGDRLWERPGGQEFAIDAYAQALLFDPDHEPAASRASLTPGQLARLASRAASREFSETELIAAEPLVVLAEGELAAESEELRGIRERIARRTRDRDLALARLQEEPAPKPERPRPPPAPAPAEAPAMIEEATTGATTAATGEAATTGGREAPAEAPRAEPRRDPAAAARLVGEAREAARGGHLADAERLYERALAHDSRSTDALAGLAENHFHRGAYSKALTVGGRALKLAPNDAALHLLVGDAAFKVFRYDDAEREYRRAQELGHPEAGRRLAKLQAKLED